MPDENKEVVELQKRILNLEETIASLKKNAEDREKKGLADNSTAKIGALEAEVENLKKEKAELAAKIWDGKDRRGKERRTPSERKTTNLIPDEKPSAAMGFYA